MATVVANGLRFNVQRLGQAGKAGTVVCLHGLIGDNLSSFYYTLANPLAQHMEVVLYDLRGHGFSERPPTGYRPGDAAEDLHALLGELAVRRPLYLCGNSYGSLVAVDYAIRHPDGIDGLVLIEGHLVVPGWGEQMAETVDLGMWVIDEFAAEAVEYPGAQLKRKSRRQLDDARKFVADTTLVSDLRFAPPTDLAALAQVTVPTLAVYGEHSDVMNLGRLLAETLPRCELRVLSDASHSVLMEDSPRVFEEVRSWILEEAQHAQQKEKATVAEAHEPDPHNKNGQADAQETEVAARCVS